MPWQGEGDASRQPYKYQYHPGGNSKNAPKDAPSALNSVIVPNVNLPSVSSVAPGESEQIDACVECILRFVMIILVRVGRHILAMIFKV
jgi:hypothetical protein